MLQPYFPDTFIPPLIGLVCEYVGSEELSNYASAELSNSDLTVPAAGDKLAGLEEKTGDHKKLLTHVANYINGSELFFWTNRLILLKWGTRGNSTVVTILTSPPFIDQFSSEFSESRRLSQIFAQIVKPVPKQTRQPDTCMIVNPRVRWYRMAPA